MKYAKIPHINKKVSRIFYGTAIEPFMKGENREDLLDAVYAAGVTAFDTARVYQNAEKSLGQWIEKRGNREDIVLLSKCGHPSVLGRKRVNEKEMRKDFAKSARYLNTDYIDIYLLHRDDPEVDVGEIVEIFNAMHAEGKIRAFGGSNWTHTRIEEANEYAYKHSLIPFAVSSPNYGLADQIRDPWGGGCVTISGSRNQDAREWYASNKMPVIAYSSLGHGFFSGRFKGDEPEKAAQVLDKAAMKAYDCPANFERLRRCEEIAAKRNCSVAKIAMAWLYGQRVNVFAVVSTTSPIRMQENIEALSLKLSDEERKYLAGEGLQ